MTPSWVYSWKCVNIPVGTSLLIFAVFGDTPVVFCALITVAYNLFFWPIHFSYKLRTFTQQVFLVIYNICSRMKYSTHIAKPAYSSKSYLFGHSRKHWTQHELQTEKKINPSYYKASHLRSQKSMQLTQFFFTWTAWCLTRRKTVN